MKVAKQANEVAIPAKAGIQGLSPKVAKQANEVAIPAKAGIQGLSPMFAKQANDALAGTTLGSRVRGNDKREVSDAT